MTPVEIGEQMQEMCQRIKESPRARGPLFEALRGGWHVEPLQATNGADLAICGKGRVYAVVQHDPDIQTDDEPNADTVKWHGDEHAIAQLLACTPAMLEALKRLHSAADQYRRHGKDRHLQELHDAMGQAEQAIDAAQPTPTADTKGDSITFTAFCQQSNGRGTIWIDQVEATSVDAAAQAACESCAGDWGCQSEDVHCLGLIKGEVEVVQWNDLDA